MLDKAAIVRTLKTHEPALRRRGIKSLYLFGSYARDEATPRSDVDLFFDYDDPHFSLFDVMDVGEDLAALLDCKVDVMTRSSLHPTLKQTIEKAALRVF